MALVVRDELVALENQAASPGGCFRVGDWRWTELIAGTELVLHSHPNGEPCPSFLDQQQQIAIGVPWYVKPRGSAGFLFGDGSPRLPLLGRIYRYGVTDCFALVRDGLAELFDVRIRNRARRWGFWLGDGEPVFESGLAAEGFEVVGDSLGCARPGDVVLFRVRSRVANHAALVLEGGQMLHHVTPGQPFAPTYMSLIDGSARWGTLPLQVARHA